MTTMKQNAASERLRKGIEAAIDTLAQEHPLRYLEFSGGLSDYRECFDDRGAADFLLQEILDAVETVERLRKA